MRFLLTTFLITGYSHPRERYVFKGQSRGSVIYQQHGRPSYARSKGPRCLAPMRVQDALSPMLSPLRNEFLAPSHTTA